MSRIVSVRLFAVGRGDVLRVLRIRGTPQKGKINQLYNMSKHTLTMDTRD